MDLERSTPLLLLTLAALTAASGWTRARADQARPPAPELSFDIPPFPAEVARPFSFGFRSVVSDFAFLEAIQVYGGRKSSLSLQEGLPEDRSLVRLLTYSTDLDPKFRGAYRFAGDALPRTTTDGKAANVFAAQLLLQKGASERADDWRIHFLLGFIDSYYLGEREAAAAQFAEAARIDGAPGYLGFLATRLASHAGDLAFAEQLARTMLEQASEESTRKAWEARLLDIGTERRAQALEAAVDRYRAREGRLPAQLEQLVPADIPLLPDDPRGGKFFIDDAGEIRSTAGERLRMRTKNQNQSGLIPR